MRKIQAFAWLLTPVTRNKTEYRSRDYDDTIFHRTNTRKRHFGEDPNACPDNTSHSPESRKRREGQRRAERSRFLYYRGRGGGRGTMETTWAYYEAIVWGTMINARLRERKRGVEWGEGLAQSLRDYGRTGHQKIDRTDYVLDDFKPILNAAILSLRGLTPSIPIFLFFSRSCSLLFYFFCRCFPSSFFETSFELLLERIPEVDSSKRSCLYFWIIFFGDLDNSNFSSVIRS